MESEEIVIFDHSEVDSNDDDQNLETYQKEESEVFVNVEHRQAMEKLSSWSDICRVCANSNDHIIPIFEAEGAQHDLSDKIHKYLPIRVAKTDTLPVQLCYHCAATILAWHELLEGCVNAQRQLLQMQSDHSYKEQNNMKCSENSSKELVDDLGSMPLTKQELCMMDQQEEELEQSIVEEESTSRLKKIGAKKRRREKAVKITMSENIIDKFHENNDENGRKKRTISESSETLIIEETAGECFGENEERTKDVDKKIVRKKKISNDAYICDLCGKKFLLRSSLKSHLKLHTGLKYFTCHICGKQFTQNGCLYYHLKYLHGGVKNHSCDICGRSFAMKSAMEDHRRSIHTGERPYICHSCGKTFATKSSLYIHSRTHTQNYPYQCKYCQKSFRWKQQLIGHVTIHTGEKKHVCDVCGKAFGVKNQLTRHKRTHETTKPYTCEKCGISFGQKRYLSTHERSKHK
ncbi:zinc finger protein with KRAB and SCAN domains 8-like isoform X3 [Venturia canescens]|uniref:zinc finger protein with KRAB and SCAN domains 8-like isoform X3 n=1 Tax=Venturia canescens TaxID=32260 RepID=UPI001C9D5998|nr:zinc finger protein with KRAB and SCAN domains 8-like isoform X3 [Venturia canescens]